MADIFGHKIPQGGAKEVLAVTALISVPLAIIGIAGYGLYRGVRFAADRLRPETEEELAARLESTYRENFPENTV